MSFLPENFELDKWQSSYTNIWEWDVRIRILSDSLTGYQYYNTDNKPVRSKDKPEWTPSDIGKNKFDHTKDNKIVQFISFVVWNYNTKQIEVCTIDKKTVIEQIWGLYMDTDFWDPKWYDIKIKKTWEGNDTKYTVLPWKIEETSDDIKTQYINKNVDLEKLFEWWNPME